MPVDKTSAQLEVLWHEVWENGVARDTLDNGETLVYTKWNTLVTYSKEGAKKEERLLTKIEIERLRKEVEETFQSY